MPDAKYDLHFDIEMQQTMFPYRVWSINAQRNVKLRYLHVLMLQERLHYIKKATRNHFRGFKTLVNGKPVCLGRMRMRSLGVRKQKA